MKKHPPSILIFFILIFICLANLSGCANGHWDTRLVEKKTISEIGAEYREILFSSRRDESSFRVHCVKLAPKEYKAILVDNLPNQRQYPLIDKIAKNAKAKIAINGGYFKKGFLPDGLYVLEGKKVSPFSPNPVLSGILRIDRNGLIELLPATAKPLQSVYAIQAGPFIVDPGGKMGISAYSDSPTRRTIVALSQNKDLLLVTTSDTTLFKLADALISNPDIFGVSSIERALNLDGGPSTAMFVDLANKPIVIKEQGPIRNVLVVSGKEKNQLP